MQPSRGGESQRSDGRLDSLLRRGSHQQVLDLVEDRLSQARGGTERAELLHAQSRAQMGLQRRHSARISAQRAFEALGDESSPLAGHILKTRGEAELALGNQRDAATSFGKAYELASRNSAEADQLAWSAWYAWDQAGAAEASAWKRRIRHRGSRSLATRKQELDRLSRKVSPTPSVASVPSSAMPSTARAILPELHERREWKAAAIRGSYNRMDTPTRITVHHGATPFSSTSNAAAASELRDMQRFHQKDRGWADLGYHFVIDPAGRVWEGRALRYQGAHAGDSQLNKANIGICVLGNYETQPLMPIQQRALAQTLQRLQAWFHVPTSRVYTHGEIRAKSTDCPGVALQRWVNDYRSRSAAIIARQ